MVPSAPPLSTSGVRNPAFVHDSGPATACVPLPMAAAPSAPSGNFYPPAGVLVLPGERTIAVYVAPRQPSPP
eukprot:9064340-Karenia_brevis.AAC.1